VGLNSNPLSNHLSALCAHCDCTRLPCPPAKPRRSFSQHFKPPKGRPRIAGSIPNYPPTLQRIELCKPRRGLPMLVTNWGTVLILTWRGRMAGASNAYANFWHGIVSPPRWPPLVITKCLSVARGNAARPDSRALGGPAGNPLQRGPLPLAPPIPCVRTGPDSAAGSPARRRPPKFPRSKCQATDANFNHTTKFPFRNHHPSPSWSPFWLPQPFSNRLSGVTGQHSRFRCPPLESPSGTVARSSPQHDDHRVHRHRRNRYQRARFLSRVWWA